MGRLKGFKHSEETKQKQRKTNIGKHNHDNENNPFYGRQHTQESKDKMSKQRKGKNLGKDNPNYDNHKLKGHRMTPEQCEKIRQSKLGNKATLGLKHTEKSKEKMRNAIHTHHIYLKENSTETLDLSCGKHSKLHSRAYDYLYYAYGKEGIDNYIKWFDEKYGLNNEGV